MSEKTQEVIETKTPIVILTDKAREKLKEIRANEDNPQDLALWLEVAGANGAEFAYDMYLERLDDVTAAEVIQNHDDLSVVIPKPDIDKLRGATLDISDEGGLVIFNPNRPPEKPASAANPQAPVVELSGDVAERVQQVLTQSINPSIASHGGQAELVAIEEDVAYLRLNGGCQGCGMAKATLTQGIEVAITDHVPEITKVVDVTDHASGTNPYYEASTH